MIGRGSELIRRLTERRGRTNIAGNLTTTVIPEPINTLPLQAQAEKKQERILGKGLPANTISSSDPCFALLIKQFVWHNARASYYDRLLISGWNVVGGEWNETPENPNQSGIYSVSDTEGVTNYILNINGSVTVLHTSKGAVIAEKRDTPHLLTRVGEVVQEANANGKPGKVFYCYEVTIPPTADEIRSALATKSRSNTD